MINITQFQDEICLNVITVLNEVCQMLKEKDNRQDSTWTK